MRHFNNQGLASIIGTVLMMLLITSCSGVLFYHFQPILSERYSNVITSTIVGSRVDDTLKLTHMGGNPLTEYSILLNGSVIKEGGTWNIGESYSISLNLNDNNIILVNDNYQTLFYYSLTQDGEESENPPENPPINHDFYVDDDYNPFTTGWGITHFNTIQDAIDNIWSGGSIYVYDGVYVETIEFRLLNHITLDGESKENTIINGNQELPNNAVWIRCSDYIEISGFTITNGYASGIHIEGGGEGGTSNYCRISNCIIHSNNQAGISIDSNKDALTRYNIIENNTIYNNGLSGIWLFSRLEENIFQYNMIYGNGGWGIYNYQIEEDNIFYHNYLLENDDGSIYDDDSNNYSYNYYYDYTGVDNDGDGIGDTPYSISGGANTDDYPLISYN